MRPFIIFLFALTVSCAAFAQGTQPPMPAPLKALTEEGAQVRYLGQHSGLDGWITVKGGQQQYFYSTTDGKALLMGLLFDADGKLVTVRQVKELQARGGEGLENLLPADAQVPEPAQGTQAQLPLASSPAEQLFENVGSANWIVLGVNTAPAIYSFIDPQCPHCKEFLKDLRPAIDAGQVQVRLIPVGCLTDKSKPQAAFLLAAPDASARFMKHLDGDEGALPVQNDINAQGAERNLAIMTSWKFDATPITIYRGKDGKVKIIQGRATDLAGFLSDIAPLK